MAEVWTIGKILKWTEEYFKKNNIDSPRLDAEVLLGYVLKKERIYLYVHFEQPLNPDELAYFKSCIKKRVQRMPVAYITGHREFMGLDFKVTADTLVPRPETEILVEAVLQRLPKTGASKDDILKFADIGTGSGAICLSLLNYESKLQAVTVDISAAAIQVAKENAERLEVVQRVEFLQGDMLQPLRGQSLNAIVSNPPYIPSQDIDGLQPEVKEFEPMGALDGGTDGLDFYRQLIAGASVILDDDGFLAMELGINQAEPLREMAIADGSWNPEKIEIIKDLANIDRVMVLWKK